MKTSKKKLKVKFSTLDSDSREKKEESDAKWIRKIYSDYTGISADVKLIIEKDIF